MAIPQPWQTASSVSTADTICCFILWEGRKEGRKEDYLFIIAFRDASLQSLLSSGCLELLYSDFTLWQHSALDKFLSILHI